MRYMDIWCIDEVYGYMVQEDIVCRCGMHVLREVGGVDVDFLCTMGVLHALMGRGWY